MPLDGFLVRILGLAALFAACAANAQLLPAKADSLHSAILGQDRAVEVYLPQESAKDPAQRYETIYVLDGDWNAKIVVDIVMFMRQVGFMPPVIVVGVPNFFDANGINSRDHDLTPTVVADQPRSGGAAAFLSFLKTELVPYIDGRYPTNGTHLIHGHSFGGLFLMYALVNDPKLFDGYLILDPAMSWDQHRLDASIESSLAGTPAKGKAIYIAARSGPAFDYMGVSAIEPIFQHKAPADLHWKITAYPDETHDSLKLKGTYDALKFAYQGYTSNAIEVLPSHGILIKGKPMLVEVGNERFDMRYTSDGSVPDASSPEVGETLTITDPEKTTIKLLSTRGTFDRVIALKLRSGAAMVPDKRAADDGGATTWQYAFYPAQAWPKVDAGKPLAVGTTEKAMDFSQAQRDDFAGAVDRYLDVPADGYYVFHVDSTDQARLSLSGKALIDVDASKGPREQAFVVPLQRGRYHARLVFRHASRTSDVRLTVFQCRDDEPRWWKNVLFHVSG